MKILQPDGWARPRGYSHGIVAEGRSVYVAGQIGTDPDTHRIAPGGFGPQLRQALANTLTILKEAGAGPEHIAEMHWFVTDIAEYRAAGKEIGEAWKETLGRNFPAITLVQVAGLLDEDAKVEISTTAVLP
ncbi:MAG: RidA family protein [Alphaproteobacteria bacterium]